MALRRVSSRVGGGVAGVALRYPCYQLIYRSTALTPVFSHAHLDMLRSSIRSNREHGLTGFLVREKDEFIQVLEGAQSKVEMIYDRIQRDRRHKRVLTLHYDSIPSRGFADWDMGFTVGAGVCDLIDRAADFETVREDVLARIVGLARHYAAKNKHVRADALL